jgi:hypothetical protein
MWLSKKLWRNRGVMPGVFFAALLVVASGCDNEPPIPKAGAAENSQESANMAPAAGELEGWTPAGEAQSFSGDRLFEHINGGADIFFEYGFDWLLVQQYDKEDKSLSLEIYRMKNPAAAYGIFSYNRHPSLSDAGVGSDGAVHPNGLFFWQDRYLVDIRQLGTASIPSQEFSGLAQIVSGKIGTQADRPEIMELLPQENRLPKSEVFARGRLAIDNQVYLAEQDLFGLTEGEAAAIARYRVGQPEFSVVLAHYSSEEACREAFARIRKHFLGDESSVERQFTASTMPGKHSAAGERGVNLVVVANAQSEDAAMQTLNAALENLNKSFPSERSPE